MLFGSNLSLKNIISPSVAILSGRRLKVVMQKSLLVCVLLSTFSSNVCMGSLNDVLAQTEGYNPYSSPKSLTLGTPVVEEYDKNFLSLEKLDTRLDVESSLYYTPFKKGFRPPEFKLKPDLQGYVSLSNVGDMSSEKVFKKRKKTTIVKREKGVVVSLGGALKLSNSAAKTKSRKRTHGDAFTEKDTVRGRPLKKRGVDRRVPSPKYREEKVHGTDKREKVLCTETWPWSPHGSMRMFFEKGGYLGSGTLVGKQFVLTAGHNLHDRKTNQYTTSISFYPGLNADAEYAERPPLVAKASGYFIHPKYCDPHCKKEEVRGYDMGLVVVDYTIGEKVGWYGMKVFSDAQLRRSEINVTGYPGEVSLGYGCSMYTMKGSIWNVGVENIFYGIDTSGGQSGGGIWMDGRNRFFSSLFGAKLFCVGVHGYGGTFSNAGVKLTEDKLKMLKGWMKSVG